MQILSYSTTAPAKAELSSCESFKFDNSSTNNPTYLPTQNCGRDELGKSTLFDTEYLILIISSGPTAIFLFFQIFFMLQIEGGGTLGSGAKGGDT